MNVLARKCHCAALAQHARRLSVSACRNQQVRKNSPTASHHPGIVEQSLCRAATQANVRFLKMWSIATTLNSFEDYIIQLVVWGELIDIFPGIYNKFNNCNSTKDSLCSKQARLRGMQLKHPMVGKLVEGGGVEEGKGKCRDAGSGGSGADRSLNLGVPCIPELPQSLEREEFRLSSAPLMAHSPAWGINI